MRSARFFYINVTSTNSFKTEEAALKADGISDEGKTELKTKNKSNKDAVEKAKSEIAGKIKVADEAENTDLIKELIIKHWTKEAQKTASAYNAKAKPGQKIEAVNIDSVISSATKVEKSEKSDINESSDSTISSVTDTQDKQKAPVVPKDTDVYKKLGKSEYNLMKKVYQVLNSENRLDDKTKDKIKAKLVKKILAE